MKYLIQATTQMNLKNLRFTRFCKVYKRLHIGSFHLYEISGIDKSIQKQNADYWLPGVRERGMRSNCLMNTSVLFWNDLSISELCRSGCCTKLLIH